MKYKRSKQDQSDQTYQYDQEEHQDQWDQQDQWIIRISRVRIEDQEKINNRISRIKGSVRSKENQ